MKDAFYNSGGWEVRGQGAGTGVWWVLLSAAQMIPVAVASHGREQRSKSAEHHMKLVL